MQTSSVLQRFYKACQDKGLTPRSVKNYESYLRHFADDFPELPTDTESIESFLKQRHEGPGRRGQVHKMVQAFYTWLETADGIKSPVPSRGKMGRPPKQRRETNSVDVGTAQFNLPPADKLVGGGINLSKYTSISTTKAVLAFLQRRKVQGCSPKTIIEYTHVLRRFALMFPVVPLKPQEFDKFLNNPKWNGETRFTYRRDLIAFYHFLEQFHYIPKDLVTVPMVDKGKTLRRILTREELQSLLAHISSTQEKSLIQSLIDTKCRIGELLSITREKLYPDHARVTGKVGERDVMLTPDTYTLLCSLSSAGPVFQENGKVLSVSRAYQILHALMLRSGLTGKKLGPHILRHTAATQHIMAGGDMQTLQQELGHTTPIMTAHYAHLATDQLAQKHQQLDLLHHLTGGYAADSRQNVTETPRVEKTAPVAVVDRPPKPSAPADDEPPRRLGIRTRTLV